MGYVVVGGICFLLGGVFGMVIMAMCVISGKDEHDE